MSDSKALFDYWYDRVQLKNHALISSPDHVQTPALRHECTNYDDLRFSQEVQSIEEPERSKVIAIIKYECTAKVLQFRSGQLRDRANQLEDSYNKLDKQQSKLLGLIQALQKKLFGKDKELKKLGSRVKSLEADNEALRAEAESSKAETELREELEQLKKQYDAVEKRRWELAKNNQSLGGRVAHTKRYKAQRDEAIAEVKALKDQLSALSLENQQLREENQKLQAQLGILQNPGISTTVEAKTS